MATDTTKEDTCNEAALLMAKCARDAEREHGADIATLFKQAEKLAYGAPKGE